MGWSLAYCQMGGYVKRHHKYTSNKKEGKKPGSKSCANHPFYMATSGQAATMGPSRFSLSPIHCLQCIFSPFSISDFMDNKVPYLGCCCCCCKNPGDFCASLLPYLRAIQTWQAKRRVCIGVVAWKEERREGEIREPALLHLLLLLLRWCS